MMVRLWILTCWFMLTCVYTASAQESPPRGFRIKLGPKVEATKTRGTAPESNAQATQGSKKVQKAKTPFLLGLDKVRNSLRDQAEKQSRVRVLNQPLAQRTRKNRLKKRLIAP